MLCVILSSRLNLFYHASITKLYSYTYIHTFLNKQKGTIHARRQANQVIREKPALTKLFEILGPRYQDRDGGYTRVMKLAKNRAGDNAPMAVIEYVDRPGEIRAARPPPRRVARNLEEVLEAVGIRSGGKS